MTEVQKIYKNIYAPVIIDYVHWVLLCAQKSDIKRLYFMARDGYPMYLSAKKLAEVWKLDIEIKYIRVSRYALRMPEYHLIARDSVEYICVNGVDITPRKIMRRAMLTDEEGKQIWSRLNCGYDYDDVLTYNQINRLKDVLISDKEMWKIVYMRSMEKYEAALGYLEEQGMKDDINYAIVDSGWIGTIQKTLSNLLNRKIQGFYFGLYEIPKSENQEDYKSFYFHPYKNIGIKAHFSNSLFETVFTENAGMTIGYEKKGIGYIPVLSENDNPNSDIIESFIEVLEQYAMQYANSKEPDDFNERRELKKCRKALKKAMSSPSPEMVDSIGRLKFCDDIVDGEFEDIARNLSYKEIKNLRFMNKLLILTGIKKEEIHESGWIEGSIVRRGKYIKKNLMHAYFYNYFRFLRKAIRH